MTTVYVLAALILIAAGFFALIIIPSPVRVVPKKPEPSGDTMIWKVDFRLWWGSRRAGYIVQHIRVHRMETTCADREFANATHERVEFWEAWAVPAGGRTPDRPAPGAAGARDFDDAFQMVIDRRTLAFGRGRVRQEVLGELRFFPGMILPGPPDFMESNPRTQAGHAVSGVAPPPGWRAGGTRHEMVVNWDNCGEAPKWDIQELPKFQE